MKKKLIWRLKIASLMLLAGGLLSSGQILEWYRGNSANPTASIITPSATTPYQQTAGKTLKVSGKPNFIQLPSRGISLEVAEGSFNRWSQSWTLSDDKAHWATNTMIANNQEGLTFIYGHNTERVFGALNNIQPGDTAIVRTDTGSTFTYKFRDSKEVAPTDVSLFNYKGAPVLVLQTCSGAWSEKRHLLTFDLVEVK